MKCRICERDLDPERFRLDADGHRRSACITCAQEMQNIRRYLSRTPLPPLPPNDEPATDPNITAFSPTQTTTAPSTPPSPFAQSTKRQLWDRLFRIAKHPVPFEAVCDQLDLPPKRARSVIEEAVRSGYPIQIEHDHIGVRLPQPRENVQESGIAPTVGERQQIGVMSDTHYGSKYCLRGAIKDFVRYAYDRGVREIVHCGDMLDGDYRHGKFEMTHMGLSAQTRDMLKNLPRHDGLTYHTITGNHDFTFTEQSGVDVGRYIRNAFLADGRDDFYCYGDRGAFISIRGIVIHLWHPSGGGSYAKSYKLQKKIESYSPGMKPHLLLTGHYHQFCVLDERGIHAMLCPTFQSGESAFSKSLSHGAPAIGGLILEFDLTEDGTMRNLSIERRTYFRRETAFRADVSGGIEV